MTDADLLEGLVDAALAASAEIMTIYGTDFGVALKADASPVTDADERAEAVILARLARLCPQWPVVAEESVAAGRAPAALGRRFLLVDPLDGTKEFVSRNGEFTVNIGVIEDGSPVAGVVVAPAQGLIWAGIVGQGAWTAATSAPAVRRNIAARPVRPEALCVLASRSHGTDETEAMLGHLAVAERISAGSSLKFCRIAEGAADVYPRLGRTMEWDTAAGDAVLRAAGGVTLTCEGTPLVYGKRGRADEADFANPWFVAVGRDAPAGIVPAMAACRPGA